MSTLELQGLGRDFVDATGCTRSALHALDLSVAEGETLCLIGTSGSGKTTVLKLVNRLLEPTRGRVLLAGQDVAAADPIALRRGMGWVIQSGGLFPHLSVAANIGLLPTLEGWDPDRVEARTRELLERVRLPPDEFAHRWPQELSGGQRQRVGVARALALDPPIVLMDEPFGALDPITRGELRRELTELDVLRHKTVLFVTHDMAEAFAVGDRVALLDAGKLVQLGTEQEIRDAPADDFVAAFFAEHFGEARR